MLGIRNSIRAFKLVVIFGGVLVHLYGMEKFFSVKFSYLVICYWLRS